MNHRLSELERLHLEDLHEDQLLLVVDVEDKVTYAVSLGDIRKYTKYGPQRKRRFRKREEKHLFEEPQKESFWKRLKRLLFP